MCVDNTLWWKKIVNSEQALHCYTQLLSLFKIHSCTFWAAFGDFSGGFGGLGTTNVSLLTEGIDSIHRKGGKAKMAYGGALYDMSSFIHDK